MAVVLKKKARDGMLYEATFLPEKGMNLISFKKDEVEIIDQSTRSLFEERYAGLGALIGPHFHHRKEELITAVPFEERFPHIARVKAKGVKEPFSHGIARYAPWNYSAKESLITARITGNDTWNDVLLSSLEGYMFAIYMNVELREDGLFIELSVEADRPSVVGTHYYYALGSQKTFIETDCKDQYFDGKNLVAIPEQWKKQNKVMVPISEALDLGFFPQKTDKYSEVLLHTDTHKVSVRYESHTGESSFQLFHPKDASYVCIEPLSATFPRQPKLSSSGVNLYIEII